MGYIVWGNKNWTLVITVLINNFIEQGNLLKLRSLWNELSLAFKIGYEIKVTLWLCIQYKDIVQQVCINRI